MAQVLCHLPKNIEDEKLLVGVSTSDDAAVYKIAEDNAMIQTVDFFTPVVDDPYTFGQIAAANSLSDVYAMGGEPKLAMNIICFPDCLPTNVMSEILKGGYDKVTEAGAMIVGGHTIEDDVPKYGLTVTGFVHPQKVLTNAGAKEGDVLVITKPLGIGVINTAIKGQIVTNEIYNIAVKNMTTLNKFAKDAAVEVGINSLTDVTGFGLLGHALEMAEGSNVTIKIKSNQIPIIKDAKEYASMGLIPEGAYANMGFLEGKVSMSDEIAQEISDIMYDPQTSGGLLMSVPKEKVSQLMDILKECPTECAVIGEVCPKEDKYIVVE